MNPVLVDTHVVLWWLADSPRLGSDARSRLLDHDMLRVSAATTWEVAIKTQIGKLELDLPDGASFHSVVAAQGFELVPVTHEDAWAVGSLPPARTDPFDRLIAATALRRGWTVATADPAFDGFGVPLLKV